MTWIWHGTPELDAESHYPRIIAAIVSTLILMIMTVLLRAYVRWRLVKDVGPDDWIIFVSMASHITVSSLIKHLTTSSSAPLPT